jgi:hypothetical protein
MAPMPRRVPLLLLCLLALAAPTAAFAQDPFAPLPPAQTIPPQQDTPTVTASTTSSDGGGLQGWQELLIFFAGGVLLLGIGWAIVADARQAAPADDTAGIADAKTRSEADHKRRKQQARAASKRARAARKRNR